MEGSGRDLIYGNSRDIYLEVLRKTTKIFNQDSRPVGRDFKPGPREREIGGQTSRRRCSVRGFRSSFAVIENV